MMLSKPKIARSVARPILAMAACLVFLTAPYLQANQTVRINAGSACHCSSHCCCKADAPADDHCRMIESRQSCHCEMEQDRVPAQAPLDVQTPESKPSNYQSGTEVVVYNSIADHFMRPARMTASQDTQDPTPIYISVSSLLI